MSEPTEGAQRAPGTETASQVSVAITIAFAIVHLEMLLSAKEAGL